MFKIILLIILIIILIFLIWDTFFRKEKKVYVSTKPRKKPYDENDIKYKFFKIAISIAEDRDLSKGDRNKIYKALLEIVEILKSLDKLNIDNVNRYEIEKIVNDYLTRLINTFLNSKEKDVDKLLEGINIIKAQLLKIEKLYRDNSSDLEKELEFLKRKFS